MAILEASIHLFLVDRILDSESVLFDVVCFYKGPEIFSVFFLQVDLETCPVKVFSLASWENALERFASRLNLMDLEMLGQVALGLELCMAHPTFEQSFAGVGIMHVPAKI